jgi:spermidine synthase
MGQVILLRELNVALYGVELIYILAMAVWLLWSAVGAMLGPRAWIPSKSTVGWTFAVFSVVFFLDVLFIRYLRLLAGAFTGTFLPFPVQLAALVTALLPAGILMGILFQWSGKIRVAGGGRLAKAYAIESLGGVTGGGCATLFFFIGAQNLTAAWICSGVAVITWVWLCFTGIRRMSIGGVIITVIASGIFLLPSLDLMSTRWNHPDLVDTRDSPYGRLTLTKQSEQFVLFDNDVLSFETQSVEAESLVHLAALSLKRIEAVAVIGGGMEGLLHEVIRYHPQTIDYVEIDPVMIDLLRQHIPDPWISVLDHPSVHIIEDDPRQFLKEGNLYDLILIGMPQPESGAANRFYTREFFQLARQHLRSSVIIAFRLRAGENIWSAMTTLRNASVWQALKSEFPYTVALPGASVIILASLGPIPTDPDVFINRMKERQIKARLVSPPYITYLFTNDRYMETGHLLDNTNVAINSDTHPISYSYSVMIWLSKFMPSLIHLRPTKTGNIATLLVPIIVVIILGWVLKQNPRYHDVFWMGAAGFMGMILETLVLLYYQAGNGVLYQNIGALIMAFMAGLWVGAHIVANFVNSGRSKASMGGILFAMIAAAGALIAGMILTQIPMGAISALLLLFLTGFAVAGIFVVTGSGSEFEQQQAASEIYAADLAGGCIGAVAGSLWLVPLFGMLPTASLIVVTSLVAIVLVRPQ